MVSLKAFISDTGLFHYSIEEYSVQAGGGGGDDVRRKLNCTDRIVVTSLSQPIH